MKRTHYGQHEDCFGCKILTVGFGASAMPTRRAQAVANAETEKRWAKDFAAYRSMRKEGLQPQSSDGAHDLMMRATTREEVEGLPKLYNDRHEILQDTVPQR